MTQREEIKTLREEIAELRKELSAMAVAMVELAAKQPSVIYYQPYVAPQPRRRPVWRPSSPFISCGDNQAAIAG